MSQVFDNEGRIVPVTVIEAGPCFITQINPVRNQRLLNGVKTSFSLVDTAVKMGKTGRLG